MQALAYAFLAVFAAALIRIILRMLALSGARPFNTLIIYNLGSFLIILSVFGVPRLDNLRTIDAAILLLVGILWTAAMWLDLRSAKELDASTGELFGSCGFIITSLAGVFILGDRLSWGGAAGMLLVVATSAVGISALRFSLKGCALRTLAVCIGGAATILSKVLSATLPIELIMLVGVLVPGISYLILGFREVRELPLIIAKTKGWILAIPLLVTIDYFAAMKALALGSLVVSLTIFQSCIVFVFLIEWLVLRQSDRLLKRGIACSCALAGVILIIAT